MLQEEPIKMHAWLAKSNFKFAKNNKATVRIPKVVHLASTSVVKAMAKTFESVSRDAHYITVAARVILADRVSGKIYQEDELFGAERKVAEHIMRINEFFDRRIAQAEQKIALAGADASTIIQRTQAYEAECTTRTATDYLQVIKKADIYLGMLEYLWIMQELSDNPLESLQAKLNSEKEVISHLVSIPRKLTSQFQVINKLCRGVVEKRRADSVAQSERDKKKHQQSLVAAQIEQNVLAGTEMEGETVITGEDELQAA